MRGTYIPMGVVALGGMVFVSQRILINSSRLTNENRQVFKPTSVAKQLPLFSLPSFPPFTL